MMVDAPFAWAVPHAGTIADATMDTTTTIAVRFAAGGFNLGTYSRIAVNCVFAYSRIRSSGGTISQGALAINADAGGVIDQKCRIIDDMFDCKCANLTLLVRQNKL